MEIFSWITAPNTAAIQRDAQNILNKILNPNAKVDMTTAYLNVYSHEKKLLASNIR